VTVRRSQEGFSLAEVLIAMTVMLVISGAAMTALLKMMSTQATIWNRTQMHSGIRGATEVLQQEVGQAGRIALTNKIQLDGNVTAGIGRVAQIECSGACATGTTVMAGIFVGQKLVVDGSTTQETITVTAIDPANKRITANFAENHADNAAVRVLGAFATGVVPPSVTNGSTGYVLKLYGDINDDGKMVYIEYKCNTGTSGAPGNLYRNSMPWDQAPPSAAETASQILLSNITANPDGSPCFTYQTAPVMVDGTVIDFVTDVAITLTVQTQLIDPVTKQFQLETKALLNVSPRNVFNAWQVASDGLTERIQPMPPSVLALLP
jgi:prepilin-type N-terminal cleavage/methylation domain-containing protein